MCTYNIESVWTTKAQIFIQYVYFLLYEPYTWLDIEDIRFCISSMQAWMSMHAYVICVGVSI